MTARKAAVKGKTKLNLTQTFGSSKKHARSKRMGLPSAFSDGAYSLTAIARKGSEPGIRHNDRSVPSSSASDPAFITSSCPTRKMLGQGRYPLLIPMQQLLPALVRRTAKSVTLLLPT